MTKEELLQELYNKLYTGEITPAEVYGILNVPAPAVQQPVNEPTVKTSWFSFTKMLYILGAAIVVIGVMIFVAQIWDDIGAFGRILVTLGLGLTFAGSGSMLMNQRPDDSIGTIFHLMGGMLIPGGAMVLLSEMSTGMNTVTPVAITFGIIFMFYMALAIFHMRPILTFFAVANGTAFVYLFTEAVIPGPIYRHDDIYAYLTTLIGAGYLLLAKYFKEGWNSRLVSILHFFGSAGFLGAAFSRVFDSGFWQLLYFLIVLGGLALSVVMKSRSILIVSTMFMIAHISYITGEYFADSLGWPISLVLLGLIFIGLGYASVTINKKYISETSL